MNRIVLQDEGIYKTGDWILDTPTKVAEGVRELVYYHIGRQWPNLKDNITIWVDGDKLGHLTAFTLRNGPVPTTPWAIKSATIRNIPGTKVKSRAFNIVGLVNLKLEGTIDPWVIYQTGRYGFHAIGKIGAGHGFEISVLDGGTIEIEGIEAQGGFAGLRLNGDNYPALVNKLVVKKFYIHDTVSGEGQYIGSTKSEPYSRFTNVEISDGYIARTAGEAIQVQHMFGNVDIHNIQVYCADTRWMNMFGMGQSTGIQWCVDGGINKLHHIIVDGYGSIGVVPFGGHIPAPPDSHSYVHDILFNNGVQAGIYLHPSMKQGITWHFDRLHFRNFTNLYTTTTGNKVVNNIISTTNGTDKVLFSGITYDATKSRVFEKLLDPREADCQKVDSDTITYNRSGFHEPAYKIRHWCENIAGYFPIAYNQTVPSSWKAGDIAIEADETAQTYKFYKYLTDSDQTKPSLNQQQLTWDINGTRSDQPTFTETYSLYPPDDLRIIGRWKELGVPYREEIIDEYIVGNMRYTITPFETYSQLI
jgi:hypothetical protein